MPVQNSQRGQPITTAPITAPFQTEIYPFGQGGLDLNDAMDAIPVGQFSRHTNLTHTMDRAAEARPGLTVVATGGTVHHSNRRLHDPQVGTDTRIWGTDQDLRIGLSGALTVIDSGYSGDPLYLLPHRPPLSGDPWMFVADRLRMRKVRADGLNLPIGLPAPTNVPTLALDTEKKTNIAFFAGDGTKASLWTGNAGFDFSDPPNPTAAPSVIDDGEFVLNPGGAVTTAATGCYSYWGLAKALDLSKVGADDAVDDDIMAISIRFSHPALVAECRLYLVCSPNFDATVIPGTDQAGRSSDFFVKAFKPDDFALAIASVADSITASEQARVNEIRRQAIRDAASYQGFDGDSFRVSDTFAQGEDPSRAIPASAGGATAAFKDFGSIGIPLRRGDFRRYGATANCDWSTITGLVIYYQVLPKGTAGDTSVGFAEWKLTGGAGPDTMQAGAQSYDYRYTHFDTRTGAEGNPSPEMADTTFIDSLRRGINVTPTAYGDASVRQRVYRRGGSLITDWFYAGQNASDGGVFLDEESDDSISTAGSVNLDHYQPVVTVNDAGTEVKAQPVPVIFGPANGLLFALGDPYRPGHLYWCIPDQPDHWPAESNYEVCSPSEELMAGFMYGPQPFCISRERMYAIYPSLSGDQEVTVTTTACRRGLVSRWAWAIGLGGIYGVSHDGIFQTSGGAEEIISQAIEPIFRGQTVNGYPPVDFTQPGCTGIRLSIFQDNLYFIYTGTDACTYVVVYSLIYKFWIYWNLAPSPACMEPDMDTPIANLVIGGQTGGASFLLDRTVFSDNGTAITCVVRTGSWDQGRPREDKLLGDQIVDADPQGVDLVLRNRLDNETIVNAAQAFAAGTGRQRYVFDSFGTTPQRARNISTEISWSSATARPILYFLGQSIIPEPDVTVDRVTQWDDLGSPDESYVTGITLDVDTNGATKTIVVERDFNGSISTITTLSVIASGRRKIKYSWAGTPANKIRLRPTDSNGWILYRSDWISVPEPPRIAGWDTHFEADGDQYYTGIDLYCDTSNQEKQIELYVDGTKLTNPYTSETFWRVTANGRSWIHLTCLAGRGHVFHLVAIDANPGILYKAPWHLQPEPAEQANWDQNFSTLGTLSDKWIKAFLLEVDTNGVAKNVTIEIDGTVVETLSVQTSGRKVLHMALSQQRLGRVIRVYPTDGNPSRPYSIKPIFDEEPYALTRWEVQESDDGVPGYKTWLEAMISLVSTADVTLTMTIQRSHNADGVIVSHTYTIPSTEGVKLERFVPFFADKGVKRKYLFTSDSAFRLYREESNVLMQPWGGGDPIVTHPFGNDDITTPTRAMYSATAAAQTPGGGSA